MKSRFELLEIDPGDSYLVNGAWGLKEKIREDENLLKQEWGFFTGTYHRAVNFWCINEETKELMGFIAVRGDGYIFFIAVDKIYRGNGVGKYLLDVVNERYKNITCHVRTTNTGALGFYEKMGFIKLKLVSGYYEDKGHAYYLEFNSGEIETL